MKGRLHSDAEDKSHAVHEQTPKQMKREQSRLSMGLSRDSEVGETTFQNPAGEVRTRKQRKKKDRGSQ
jgi:hypothetical protein